MACSNGLIEIARQAPLSELDQYQSQLKSMTGGHGSYTIEFSHYEPLPMRTRQQLMAAFKPGEVQE